MRFDRKDSSQKIHHLAQLLIQPNLIQNNSSELVSNVQV